MPATLEHTNFTVTDPQTTAAWMEKVFGWRTRWQGEAKNGGFSVHVGEDDTYLALYRPAGMPVRGPSSYDTVGGLNHVAVVVNDLPTTEKAVRDAGFEPHSHADYEPGERFYFHDDNGIEFEVVSYPGR
ncbi:VOC family protein [Cribrihabitans sp. XS_ASV171]